MLYEDECWPAEFPYPKDESRKNENIEMGIPGWIKLRVKIFGNRWV